MTKYINKNAMKRAEMEYELAMENGLGKEFSNIEINLMDLAIEDVANGDLFGLGINWSKVYKYCDYLERAFFKIAKREKLNMDCDEYTIFRNQPLHNTVVVLTK